MSNDTQPEIRFPGFTDDWEQRKLGDFVVDYVEKTSVQNQFPMLTSSQQKGIVLQEDYFANRQVTTENNIGYFVLPRGYFTFRSRSDNDVFVFNRNDIIDRGIISYFYPVFTLKSADSDFFLRRINNGIQRQLSIQSEGTGQHVLSLKKFKNIVAMFPSEEEQQKIGTFFKQLDDTIALHQRKLDLLKETKKGFLQKMFPENGAKVPEIRFPGFTEDWEERKLGELGKTQSGIGFPDAEQGGSEGTPFFKVSDMNNIGNEYEMRNANHYVSNEQIERKKWKPIKDVPAIIFAKVGAAIMLNRKRLVTSPFLIDNNTMAYLFNNTWDIYFGKILFETINLPRYSQVGALPSYNSSDIENISVKVPVKDEQQKIGTFFKQLDDTIALHQRKLDLLKETKKSFLQKMFV
ncbi:restriction endonuclease subunit S [Enterococcus faecium]|uniref:restriction endonuclease subunit S n=1 Tax=Enterococcus faecium TaxID=1352 RepID=UPI001C296720|nr:restriction endonuclease subunit S [Enterococcus faecium]MBW1627006.1 restriction endonuclease subunit S [Enterococcus faecium]MCJ2460357.1 restriction endonuclease subunit S [Enterococcus faecium]MCJ2504081.1 restriction endonuclease subunit S [Enterococcus faecium]HAP6041352.1 restriction endonuclease subunit S [Enterococcus faecium]HBG9610230.1 restriction endonuclease subunit S [Enterococcus faecium]